MSVPESLRFTYEDYVLLPEDRRYEVIDGELCPTPAPTPYHQIVKGRIERLLQDHVEGAKLGMVLDSPCDVVLSQFDVLQPDIFFISSERLAIIGEKYISDGPELVIEVLSPGTRKRDRVWKAKRYAHFGVREVDCGSGQEDDRRPRQRRRLPAERALCRRRRSAFTASARARNRPCSGVLSRRLRLPVVVTAAFLLAETTRSTRNR